MLLVTYPSIAHAGTDGNVIILISGNSDSTPLWNLSSTATRYKSIGTSTSGTMVFSKMSEAQCERRSSDKITVENYYGTNGHIPPGVYFLDYYRIDDDNIRHRLTISDDKGGTTITTDDGVIRTYIQMHVAFNNNIEFHRQISQGCITFDNENFYRLFPSSFFTPIVSPFTSTYNAEIPYKFKGKGNILVFVTDNRNQETYKNQSSLFNKILTGQSDGLKESFFNDISSELQQLRLDWYIVGIPEIDFLPAPVDFRLL